MAYRICYGCGKVRSNILLNYLELCLFCKVRKLFGMNPNKLGEKLNK